MVFIQRMELIERIIADRSNSCRPASVPLIPPDSASEMDIDDNNLKEMTSLIYRTMNHSLNDDGKHELIFIWVPNMDLY